MSLKTSNDYHSRFSFAYTSPSCFYYYLNPSQTYELPISFEKSVVISDKQIQTEQTTHTHLHNENQRHNSNVIRKESYRSINCTETTLTSSDDLNIKNRHRLDSQKSEKHQQFAKQQTSQKSSLDFHRRETLDENQQLHFFSSIKDYCCVLRDQSTTMSNKELTDILDKFTLILKGFYNNDQQHEELSLLIDILMALIHVHPSILSSVSEHEFFSILQISFINILRQWRRLSSLPDKESFMFRTMAKLLSIVINNIDNINCLPSWLTDSTLFETIADCLTDMATSGRFLDDKSKRQFKQFTRLIDAYISYQERLNDENQSNKDKIVQLLDPILHCLTSSHFIQTFTNMQIDTKSMTTIEKFFLVKCPTFLTSYNGYRLEQTMESLLSTMLPRYVVLLDKLVPSARHWNASTIEAVHHLLNIINHGANQFPINAKLISTHLSLIDHVLKLVNEPALYNNLRETLSNPETTFMNTAINFLVNMISEPAILAHIKQSRAAPDFLRLTSCQYEPLVFNVYTLLAYTTHEEDIKAMHSPGRLLITIIESLKIKLNQNFEKRTDIEQLLETLRGLVQHDQIKDEIIRQNALPFLLECTNKLTRRTLILIFEILWCLTFFEEIARILRANSDFLEKIQIISKDNSNEPLKKAVDGLVWKLIQEPAFLEKVTKQEEEQEEETDKIVTTTQVVIGADGKKQVVTRTRRSSPTPSERLYQYDMMISYCHADKELTYKIHKFLVDQGFKVWIDLDNMYGPAMSAMADAVENSEFVIMCMSDSYKQSTYCQAEAEYAFKCKRRLLPLIMRQGYKPDGWLGLMIGSRIYIDFSRYNFEAACEKLMTEVSLQRKETIPSILIHPLDHEKPVETFPFASEDAQENKNPAAECLPKKPRANKNILSSLFKARESKLDFVRKPINQWTESDTLDFLLTHHLNQLIPLCEAMNGRALIQLYKICTTHRLRAYSVLKDELKSIHKIKLSVSVYSRFLSDIEELINIPPKSPSSAVPLPSIVPSPSTHKPPRIVPPIPFIPAPSLDMSYDFLITSDASGLDTLKMVERFGSQLQLLDSLRRRITNVY